MWYPPAAPPTTPEARAQLLALGALLRGRRPPRSPETLLTEVPPLLRLLKGRGAAAERASRAGLRRAERVAATQLLVELHDAWQAGGETAHLQAALEAFCLRAATLAGERPGPEPPSPREGQGGVTLRAPALRLYRLSCASAQSRSACARR